MDEFSFFILAGSWVALQNYPVVAASFLTGILYYVALQKIQFVFDDNSIRKINFPASAFRWSQLSNVILRDDILTLDFNNNKLIQGEIENERPFSEVEFNEFARQQLVKHSHPEQAYS